MLRHERPGGRVHLLGRRRWLPGAAATPLARTASALASALLPLLLSPLACWALALALLLAASLARPFRRASTLPGASPAAAALLSRGRRPAPRQALVAVLESNGGVVILHLGVERRGGGVPAKRIDATRSAVQ